MNDRFPRVFCLMGPTGVGKTETALGIADVLPCKLISVDSAMVYRGMDIGTAKPSKVILAQYTHSLIDIRDAAESYSAGHFRRDAIISIEEAISEQRYPLLVGGTLYYYVALQRGIADLPQVSPGVRSQLRQTVADKGLAYLYAELKQVDATAARRIHPHDSQRIERALEIYRATGKSMTQWLDNNSPGPLLYDWVNIFLWPEDRKALHALVERRFDQMLAQGLEDEVRGFYDRGDLTLNNPSMRSVGYRQIWQYFAGGYTRAVMREKAIGATRQLIKRQLTWGRSLPLFCRISDGDPHKLSKILSILQAPV